jgi:uncharacterized protein (TIGR00730 family)
VRYCTVYVWSKTSFPSQKADPRRNPWWLYIYYWQEELRQGISEVSRFDRSVTCYGSARLREGSTYYEKARRITHRIASELGYTVVTGGGPGIMEAANRGAFEAGGNSVGLSIRLPHEQSSNPYTTVEIPFYYFFTRKTSLSFASEAYIAFPGGFGTFDEMFEILTLVQTGKVPPVPIIFVGTEFWQPIDTVIRQVLLESPADVSLYTITDDEDQILDIVKNAPLRDTKNNMGGSSI